MLPIIPDILEAVQDKM